MAATTNTNTNNYTRGPLRVEQERNAFRVDLLTQKGWEFIGYADELASNKELEALRPLCDGRPMYKRYRADTYKVEGDSVTEKKLKHVWKDMVELLFCGVCIYKDNLVDTEKHENICDDNITYVYVLRTYLLKYFQQYVAKDYKVSPTLGECCRWFNEIYTADDTDYSLVDEYIDEGNIIWWKYNRKLLPYVMEDIRKYVV